MHSSAGVVQAVLMLRHLFVHDGIRPTQTGRRGRGFTPRLILLQSFIQSVHQSRGHQILPFRLVMSDAGQTLTNLHTETCSRLSVGRSLICVAGRLRAGAHRWSGRIVNGTEDGIKSHTHSASASSTDLGTLPHRRFDYGTKSTNNIGAHTHSVSGTAASAGNHTHSVTGASAVSQWSQNGSVHKVVSAASVNTSAAGAHTHSVSGTAASAGAHAHTVGIGAHTHSVAIGSQRTHHHR